MSNPEKVEQRHCAALDLDPTRPDAVRRFLEMLGDPNWRVRKAALSRLPSFADRPTLLVDLIAGLAHDTNAGLRAACSEALLQIGRAVEPLIAALHTTNANQRKIVAELLGQLGTVPARDQLIKALDDPDPNARSAVAEALGNFGGPEVIAELRRRLAANADDLQESAYLLDALGRAGARLPLEELEIWVGQREMHRQVFPLLGLSGEPRASAPLLVGLAAESRGTRGAAIRALDVLYGRLTDPGRERLREQITGDPARAKILIAAMDTEDDAVGAAAVRLLGMLGDPSVGPAIIQASASRSFLQIGLEAVQRLGQAVVGPLLDDIHNVDLDTRVLSLEMVELLGDASTPGLLTVCLELAAADGLRVAEAAVRVLGRHGDTAVIGTLIDLVERGDPDLREEIALALANIGGRHPDITATRMVDRLDAGSASRVWPYVLGEIARPEDLGIILGAIPHPDPEMRLAALTAAAAFGDEVEMAVFTQALADDGPRIRAAANRALGAYGCRDAYDRLSAALADEDPWVIAEAIRSLGIGGWQEAVPAIEEAATRGASPVVVAALQSLSRLAPEGLETTIRGALLHHEPEVVREALSATTHLTAETTRGIAMQMLGHESWDVRRGAAEVLATRGLDVPLKLIQDHLATETEPLVRQTLRRLLAGEAPI